MRSLFRLGAGITASPVGREQARGLSGAGCCPSMTGTARDGPAARAVRPDRFAGRLGAQAASVLSVSACAGAPDATKARRRWGIANATSAPSAENPAPTQTASVKPSMNTRGEW